MNRLAPARLHAYRVGTADEPYGVLAIGSADGDAPSPHARAGLEQALRCANERMSRLDAQERHARQTALMEHLNQLRDQLSAGHRVAAAGVAQEIAEAAGLTAVWIAAVDAGGAAPAVATRGIAPDLLDQLTGPSGPSHVVIRHERPLHSDDLAEEPRAPWAVGASAHGYGSAYCVPVLQAGVPIGSLGALRTEPRAFEDEELAYFELAAGFLPPLVQQLRGANSGVASDGLAPILNALDARDADSWGHARRVAHYAGVIADSLDLGSASPDDVTLAATLHDIGKIGVPDAVLRKPGPLTADEWCVMRTHPELSYNVLTPMQTTAAASITALEHQERFDGDGYPRGLAADAIHPVARIVSVADALDAMTSDRPYRSKIGFDGAMAEIQGERGRQFDPQAVDALCAAADAGTLQLTSIHDNLGLILRRSGRDPGV